MMLRRLNVAVLGAALSLSACTTGPFGDDDSEIVGGHDISIEDAPWQVSLQSGSFGHFCGGSILNEEWVLTAAHCVGGSITVVAGFTNQSESSSGQSVAVAETIRYPGYVTPTDGKDAALLRLAEPLVLDGVTVAAIDIVDEDMANAGLVDPGVMSTITGWGTLSSGGSMPDTLQSVDVPIISNADAQAAYTNETITDDQLAAAYPEGGKDACQGDSGGPLVVPNAAGDGYVLAGIVSWGYGCARPDAPGMYGRVSSFSAWINEHVGSDTGENQAPNAALSATTSDLSVEVTSESTDADGSIVSTEWDFGDGATASGTTASHTYAAAGTYTVTVTVTDDQGATDSASTDVTVEEGSTGGDGELDSGVPVGPLSAAKGGELFYTIEVPEGATKLEIQTSGGTGDADLYVRYGAAPTVSEWDYRPYRWGNDETVTIEPPSAGTYHIMLRGYQAFDGVTLVATVTEGDTGGPAEVEYTDLEGTRGSEDHYVFEVPEGTAEVTFQISGGTGDADLYVRYGAEPTQSQWDYRPYRYGNEETVTIANPAAGTYYVMLRGYSSYSGVTLYMAR